MSKTNEPVAWAVTPRGNNEEIDCEFIYPSAATAGDVALGCDGVVASLYRHPQATLTDEEREAVERAADLIDAKTCGSSATLRSLLERL